MPPKIPKIPLANSRECTDFQVHKSQRDGVDGVVDYSEHRLKRYLEKVDDIQQKLILKKLLQEYVSGEVAIAWKRGKPVWVKLSKT